MTHGALDLFVTLVADEKNVVILARKAHGLAVDLSHQGAGGIEGVEATIGCLGDDHRGYAVGGEDDVGALRDFGHLVDENDAFGFKLADNMEVVDDLLSHIHRSSKTLERLFHRDHGAVDPRAIAARGSQKNFFLPGNGNTDELLPALRDKGGV
jgi:hypothetical protein